MQSVSSFTGKTNENGEVIMNTPMLITALEILLKLLCDDAFDNVVTTIIILFDAIVYKLHHVESLYTRANIFVF